MVEGRRNGGKYKREGERKRMREGRRRKRVLLIAAQQLHSQGNAFMPRPRQDADESCVEGGLKHVLFVHVVVAVARENLQVKQKEIKMG